jgi:hypothetical protein
MTGAMRSVDSAASSPFSQRTRKIAYGRIFLFSYLLTALGSGQSNVGVMTEVSHSATTNQSQTIFNSLIHPSAPILISKCTVVKPILFYNYYIEAEVLRQ